MAKKQNNKERLKEITDSDEAELKELATSVIAKLQAMSDDEFIAVADELIGDFE